MNTPDVPDDVVARLNSGVPTSARVYNYWLGGKDNFAVDREVGDQVAQLFPAVRQIALQNRAFLRRVVRYLAQEKGIRQFLDIGSGLPTAGNVHEVAQEVAPDSRVVYVDNDPLVLVHGRALLREGPVQVIEADVSNPAVLWQQVEQTRLLDPAQPMALLLIAILHFVPGELGELVRAYLDRLAPGSYLAISHVVADNADPGRLNAGVDVYDSIPSGIHVRHGRDITGLFDGTTLEPPGVVPVGAWRPVGVEDAQHELVPPGVVPMGAWRPEQDADDQPTTPVVLGGVGLL